MADMKLNREEVLVVEFSASLDPPIIFRIGDVVKIRTTNKPIPSRNIVMGRLRSVDDDEIVLDISEKFLSKLIHISFEDITWMEKVSQDD